MTQSMNSTLFKGGRDGYSGYRIPALLVAGNGDLLAFCEGRRDSISDCGQIDLLMKRSSDNGLSWSEQVTVVTEPGMTCGNPCPVLDRQSGTILLPFCKNRADGGESEIKAGNAPRTVWLTRSDDHGHNWSEPVEITAQTKKNVWTWYATGPGHGIQLDSGRIIIPCDHNTGINHDRDDPYESHLVYSDDHGENWHIGAILSLPGNECCALACDDGSIYLNTRTRSEHGVRHYGISRDGGLSFIEEGRHQELVEPRLFSGGCEGSLLRLPGASGDGARFLFCNPATTEKARKRLTIHYSDDQGMTWQEARVLNSGLSGYSDLALVADGSIVCLFETGEERYNERMDLLRFSPKWLFAENGGAAGGEE